MSKHSRAKNIADTYKLYGVFNEKIVDYGSQIEYEMELDKQAMVIAISYLTKYIDYRSKIKDTHTFGDDDANKALSHLVNRVSKYNCPNPLKEHLRTTKNCPLKNECKCLQGVS